MKHTFIVLSERNHQQLNIKCSSKLTGLECIGHKLVRYWNTGSNTSSNYPNQFSDFYTACITLHHITDHLETKLSRLSRDLSDPDIFYFPRKISVKPTQTCYLLISYCQVCIVTFHNYWTHLSADTGVSTFVLETKNRNFNSIKLTLWKVLLL